MITKKITDIHCPAQFLLNQHILIRFGSFTGKMGVVNAVMADGRSLDVRLDDGKSIFVDSSLVRESRETDLL
jgi:hypothetical protein